MKNKGMTLFIAVTVMGILLFISFAVTNIVLKGTIFASSGRDSQFAFYAADAGIECAEYWDSKYLIPPTTYISAFATSSEGIPRTITCGGLSISTGLPITGTTTNSFIGDRGDTNPTSIFGFVMNQAGQGNNPVLHCAVVTVTKYYVGSRLWTYIYSRGYNTCDTSSPRRVERGIEVTY